MNRRKQASYRLLTLALALVVAPSGLAAQGSPAARAEPALADRAPVVIDGNRLFLVSGISVLTARERAAHIRGAIIDVARSAIKPEDLTITELQDRLQIRAGDTVVMTLLASDTGAEGLPLGAVAEAYRIRIVETVEAYRTARDPDRLLRAAGFALLHLAVLIALIWVVARAFRWLERWAERHLQRSLKTLETKSRQLMAAAPHRVLHAGRVWLFIAGLLRLLRLLILANLIYLTAARVLDLFPWTRSLADTLLSLFMSPLRELWRGLVRATPGLIFIVVLFLVFRYLLSVMAALFKSLESGSLRLQNFDPDWAMPTYKIARMVIIVLGVVIAFPYIPGSDSLAFKGISVFAGVLLSIGSSSVVSNTFAGLSMIYRRAFKVGDRVRINEVIGHVRDIRLQTTQIVTAKNESVLLPNSIIMTTNVTNFSQLARGQGLILHSTVGIGYDTPWQQVEAMLLEAARRTEVLLEEPPPFVLQRKLGDFAVDYEINAYSPTADGLLRIYSDLHANIRDVFNEYDVQIMSPAYVADPKEPKVVPPEDWFQAPAKPHQVTGLGSREGEVDPPDDEARPPGSSDS